MLYKHEKEVLLNPADQVENFFIRLFHKSKQWTHYPKYLDVRVSSFIQVNVIFSRQFSYCREILVECQ